MTDQQTRRVIVLVVVGTLSFALVSVMIVMLYGLFDARVDNHEIFELLKSNFPTIVGCFVGLLGGFGIGRATSGNNADT